jgi:hypothetical protein
MIVTRGGSRNMWGAKPVTVAVVDQEPHPLDHAGEGQVDEQPRRWLRLMQAARRSRSATRAKRLRGVG